jgi:hypothetical protein
VPTRARIGVFDDVIEAVAAQDVKVIARAMDVVGQRERYSAAESPHKVVLQHLLERVDECVTALGEHALVIADEVDGQAIHRADRSKRAKVAMWDRLHPRVYHACCWFPIALARKPQHRGQRHLWGRDLR